MCSVEEDSRLTLNFRRDYSNYSVPTAGKWPDDLFSDTRVISALRGQHGLWMRKNLCTVLDNGRHYMISSAMQNRENERNQG